MPRKWSPARRALEQRLADGGWHSGAELLHISFGLVDPRLAIKRGYYQTVHRGSPGEITEYILNAIERGQAPQLIAYGRLQEVADLLGRMVHTGRLEKEINLSAPFRNRWLQSRFRLHRKEAA